MRSDEIIQYTRPKLSNNNVSFLIDDVFGADESFEKAIEDKRIMAQELIKAGLNLQKEKSAALTSQQEEVIGFFIDTVKCTVSLTEVKLEELLRRIRIFV